MMTQVDAPALYLEQNKSVNPTQQRQTTPCAAFLYSGLGPVSAI